MYDIAIIGNGPAGISAAINAKIRNKNFVLFGQSEVSHKVEVSKEIRNYPALGIISGNELNAKMKEHLDLMEIKVTEAQITGIYKMKDKFMILANRTQYEAKSVILALGAETIKPLPNERALLGRGVSYCATCDGMLYKDKEIAVFCDNEEAEEEVKYLASLAKKIYYSPTFKTKIELSNVTILDSKISKIIGEKQVEAIKLKNESEIKVDGVFFLKQAVSADILLAKLETEKGSIIVDKNMKTNIDGCFACGDCTGTPYQISKAVGEGNIAAHSAFNYLASLE